MRKGRRVFLRASRSVFHRVLRVASALICQAGPTSLIVLGMVSAAQAAGDVKAGEGLFNRCAICHSDAKGAPNKLGPNLFGVVGRKAGTFPGYSFSDAMKRAGFVWTPAKLSDYLASPQKVVPGNNMPFAGIADPKQRAAIVAYLASLK